MDSSFTILNEIVRVATCVHAELLLKKSIQILLMKKLLFLGLLISVLMINACKDDDHAATEPEYHIHFMEPAANASFAAGDVVHVHIEFEDHNGGTVHHVNVRAYNKATGTELFNTPAEAHLHAASPYEFEYEYTLDNAAPGTYVIEAKVWGHGDGIAEVKDSREFTVN